MEISALHLVCSKLKTKKTKAFYESIYFKRIRVSFSDKLSTFYHHKVQHHVLCHMTFRVVLILLSIKKGHQPF